MSFVVLSDWISVGVDLFIVAWFAALTARGPTPVVVGPFALLAGLIAASHLANLAIVAAPNVPLAARGQEIFHASVLLAAAAFVDVATTLAGERGRLPRVTWLWCAAGAVLALAGLFHDPSFPTSEPPMAARFTPAGVFVTLVVLLLIVVAVARLVRAALRDPSLWQVVGSIFLPVVLSTWDVAARALDLPLGVLSGPVRSLVIVMLARALLQRMLGVERALAKKTEELAASTERLREAQVELDRTEQLAAVGELAAVIAHEIKNPLAVLANAATTLKKGGGHSDAAAQLLSILDEEADRLDRLVDDVLVYARPLTPQTTEVELRSIVSLAARLALESHAHATNVEVDWDAGGAPQWIQADATLLRHALVNIVDNAILAMPRGGTVRIRILPAEVRGATGVAVEFRDDGEGMNTQVRARATDPFFTTRETGTGLGLAIVDRVARVHGGTVGFESRAGVGTTVRFTLPLTARSSAPDLENHLTRDPSRPHPAARTAEV